MFVVQLRTVELSAADQVNQAVGHVEPHANAGCGGAALVAKRKGGAHGHSRFQLALGRNDEGPKALRQCRCSRRKYVRKSAHARNFAVVQAAP